MSPWFGKKKKDTGERTVLIVDVENGSAATALLRLTPGEQPKLFAETRILTPLGFTRSGSILAQEIEQATSAAIRNASEVAARIRNHPSAAPLGAVDLAAVFMAPPWGTPNLADGKPHFMDDMASAIRAGIAGSFGEVPVSFYTSAGAAAFGARSFMTDEPCLVCSVTGEVSELMHLDEQGVRAHATFPSGLHALLRTLSTHGGLSEEEARSAVRLGLQTPHVREPFAAAALDFAKQFKDAARELLPDSGVLRVAVIAPGTSAEWFARALSVDESLAELFPNGGEVRAMRTNHTSPHIAAHAETPDLHLMLEALFIDQALGG